MFSQVETMVFFTLRRYAKTGSDIGRIVFSHTSLEAAMSLIRDLIAVTDVAIETRQDLDEVFKQLIEIKNVRNHVIHNGAIFVAEGRGQSSNALKSKGQAKVYPIRLSFSTK